MNRTKLIHLSLKLANSLFSTQQLGLQRLKLTQVTQVTQSFITLSSSLSLNQKPNSCYISPILYQIKLFSSKQESFVELILSSNDWSEKIENELEKFNPKITHESVVYVLKKLNKNPQKSLGFYKWVSVKKGVELDYSPYFILIRTLACKEFMDEFWNVAYEMKTKGIKIDFQINGAIVRALQVQNLNEMLSKWIEFYKSMREVDDGKYEVVKGIVEVILGADWSEKVESKLRRVKFPLTSDFLFRVIWSLRDEPLKSLKFFKWVGSDLKYEHDSITYGGMARVLARRGLMNEFWDLLLQMRNQGCEIDNDSYVKISRSLGNVDAVKMFEFVMDGPYKLSEQECVWLLMTLAHENEPDLNLVTRVVNKYFEVGNSATKGINTCIHRVLCKLGKFEEAKNIMEDMKKKGYKPDNITYSQEIYGLCKCGRFEDARLLLNQMEAEDCIPDIKTWTILIQQYCSAGEVVQAMTCFAEMLEKNVAPDADLVEVLINGFLAHNKLLGAYGFLVKMVNNANLKPWQATYKKLIEMLLRDGKLEEAFNLLSMMKQQNYPPYPEPFVAYISKHGTVMDAKKILRALPKNGPPSTAACVKVISSFFEEGRHSEAKDLLYGCPRHVRKEQKIQKMFGMIESENNSPS